MTEKAVKTYVSGRYLESGPVDTSSRVTSISAAGKFRVIINTAQIGVGPHNYVSTNRRLKGDVIRNPKSGWRNPHSQTG